MSNQELLTIIERDLSNEAYKSLVAYAQYTIDSKYLWRRFDKLSVEGKTAEDFVQEAIYKLIEGVRNWDQSNSNLIVSLRGHIKSIIWSTFNKKEHNLTAKTLQPVSEEDEDCYTDIADNTLSQLTIIELQEVINEVYDAIKDDKEVEDIVTCYTLGIEKRQEIADYLDISPSEVTNRIKKLHRRIEKIKENNF